MAGVARKLAWGALGGQVVFVASWVVAGALEPGYSHADQGVSELGARTAEHPLIVNGGLVVFGLTFVAIGVALFAVLPSRLAAGLFVAAGLAVIASGLITLDCGLSHPHCEAQWRAGDLSWHESGHLWAGLVSRLLLALTPFALARALWPGPVAPLAAGAGFTGIAIGVGTFFLYGDNSAGDGLIQRFEFAVLHLWVLIVATGILYALRRPHAPGQLVRLRPRDFFAAEWSGEGELVARPFFLWRRLAGSFEAHRRSTFVSDRLWRFDDEARFAPGRVRRRRMYCEFVAEDRIELTAGDLPEGAFVRIEEDGYRMIPFRMEFPIGPVAIPIRVHDVSRVEPDGTLLNIYEARALVFGLRLARLTFRVRPVVRASADGPAG
ncbi:MAG: hypothetical protein QOC77_104 [Thermoleophilaceae bacterium]|jgi:hypothetical protein|nr:hypothetical protein [Thermoleophilaceae bacterium]MEA2469575.1 hypothetical protein [Thermoleophilaceae bacterium]